jgi:N-acetylglucosamine-6-phosphate deacetylase
MDISDQVIRYTNVRLIRDHKLLTEDLFVQNGRIIDAQERFWTAQKNREPYSHQTIDCHNHILVAGFIDLQINGYEGVDFSSVNLTKNDILETSEKLRKHGILYYYPTIISSEKNVYKTVLPLFSDLKLPVHLEGPFITNGGCHKVNCLQKEAITVEHLIATYTDLTNVKIITLAPEIENIDTVIRYITDKNIITSIGHTNGKIDDAKKAVNSGARMITHLFNAMSKFHHRDPGLYGLDIFYTLISDGEHVHPDIIKLIYNANKDSLILVSDMSGDTLGDIKADKLMGSKTPLNECLKMFKAYTKCSIVEAIETVTLHPAKCLKIDHMMGSLECGRLANMVLIDDDLNVIESYLTV